MSEGFRIGSCVDSERSVMDEDAGECLASGRVVSRVGVVDVWGGCVGEVGLCVNSDGSMSDEGTVKRPDSGKVVSGSRVLECLSFFVFLAVVSLPLLLITFVVVLGPLCLVFVFGLLLLGPSGLTTSSGAKGLYLNTHPGGFGTYCLLQILILSSPNKATIHST